MKEIIELVALRPAVKSSIFRGIVNQATPAANGSAVFLTAEYHLVVAEKWYSPAGTTDHVRGSSKGCRYDATSGPVAGTEKPVPAEFLAEAVSAAIEVLPLADIQAMGRHYASVTLTPQGEKTLATKIAEAEAKAKKAAEKKTSAENLAAENGVVCPICATYAAAAELGKKCTHCGCASFEASDGEDFFE